MWNVRRPAMPLPLASRPDHLRAFWPGLPDLAGFPRAVWSRLVERHVRRSEPSLLGYGDPAGYAPLREAIAAYLATTRGVQCDAGQVIVVPGSQTALGLCARLLLDPGDSVAVKDPGYPGPEGRSSRPAPSCFPYRSTTRDFARWERLDRLGRAWSTPRRRTSSRPERP